MIKLFMIILLCEALLIAVLIGAYEIKIILEELGVLNELQAIFKRNEKS